MTDELSAELAKVRALLDGLVPGPWEWDIGDGSMPTLEGTDGGYHHVLSTRICRTCYERAKLRDAEKNAGVCTDASPKTKDFIAASRTLVPRLLDVIDMLRQQRDDITDPNCVGNFDEIVRLNDTAVLAALRGQS